MIINDTPATTTALKFLIYIYNVQMQLQKTFITRKSISPSVSRGVGIVDLYRMPDSPL